MRNTLDVYLRWESEEETAQLLSPSPSSPLRDFSLNCLFFTMQDVEMSLTQTVRHPLYFDDDRTIVFQAS
jgi:hypothetical protein